jgi:hypothetical protein
MHLLRTLSLSLLLFCCLPTYAAPQSDSLPYCTASQLAIYQVALDYPGMMQSRSLYAIVNHAQKACRLKGTPAVFGLAQFQRVVLAKKPTSMGALVIVEPLNQTDLVASDQLVWFSLVGNEASNGPRFKDIQVVLPGLEKHFFNVPYAGYSSALSQLTPIQKDAALWKALENDQCPGFTGKRWPIAFKTMVQCG